MTMTYVSNNVIPYTAGKTYAPHYIRILAKRYNRNVEQDLRDYFHCVGGFRPTYYKNHCCDRGNRSSFLHTHLPNVNPPLPVSEYGKSYKWATLETDIDVAAGILKYRYRGTYKYTRPISNNNDHNSTDCACVVL